jgi:hypothetical protein
MATKGPYAEAVDTLFDRLRELYPVYVSPRRATLVALAAGAAVVALLAPALRFHVGRLRAPATAEAHLASTGVVLGAALGVALLVSTLRDVLFRADMVGANKLHFALEHWVTRYVRAAREGAAGVLAP